MSAQKHFTTDQGLTFTRTLYWRLADRVTPINLTGLQARMQVRDGATNPVALVSLTSSPAAGLTVTPLLGQVNFRIGADVMSTLPVDGDLVYGLELYDPTDLTQVSYAVSGRIRLNGPEVDR